MRWEDQGTAISGRHMVIPRTLCFILNGDDILLLRGAPTKRLWPGKLNGIGGHIEAGETPRGCARREVQEECGLVVDDLALRGLVHISSQADAAGIMLFIYVGHAAFRRVCASAEGELAWYPLKSLPVAELVEDLPFLIPKILAVRTGEFVYGLYQPNADGGLDFNLQ